MADLKEIRNQRGKAIADARAILDKADGEKRAMSEDETKQYDSLIDAVFKRRGWTQDGCPTPEHLKNIGMDLPEVLAVVEARIAGQA